MLAGIAAVCMVAVCLFSCSVHEWPQPGGNATYRLQLRFHTDMAIWENVYNSPRKITGSTSLVESKEITSSEQQVQTEGSMRYIVRAYQVWAGRSMAQEQPAMEWVFARDVAEGYDCTLDISLPDGEYSLMVWADLTEHPADTAFYDASDFGYITFQGRYCGDTDYRDAFRGMQQVTLQSSIEEKEPDLIPIEMERPLAKFEFIATDVQEFLSRKAALDTEENVNAEEEEDSPHSPTLVLNEEDYTVVFYYQDFLPTAFSLFSDRPIDAMSGIAFPAKMHVLNSHEVSLGFDYVFIGDIHTVEEATAMQVQVAIYDLQGNQVSLTSPIPINLLRNTHTILRGGFLMQSAQGGITITPDFDGEWNVFV